MILVLLGTQNNSFHRLLQEIENCISSGIIKDKVVVQSGYTKFTSSNMEIFDFIPKDKFDDLLITADLIITHGGVASIISSIKLGKKVIAVPRLAEFNEHVNNHQEQIVSTFDSQCFIKGVFDINNLSTELQNINTFIPKPFTSNNENFLKVITNFIDK